jgi:hypothetical protein
MRTVQWITILIAEHKWNYEANIPTMRTVQWITILIAEHQWNNETKHTYYENCTMNYNPDSKTPVKLRN